MQLNNYKMIEKGVFLHVNKGVHNFWLIQLTPHNIKEF